MGACSSSSNAKNTNDIITQKLKEAERLSPYYNSDTHTILTCGIKGSGISTIFKQIKQIYIGHFNDKERIAYIPYIYKQCVDQMKLIIKSLNEKEFDFLNDEKGDLDCTLSKQGIDAKNYFTANSKCKHLILYNYIRKFEKDINNIVPSEIYQLIDAYSCCLYYKSYQFLFNFLDEWNIKQTLNEKLVNSIKCLWNEALIKQIYLRKVGIDIYHSSAYFWNKMDTIYQSNYIPSTNDILLVHQNFTNVRELQFSCNYGNFSMINAMGQRNEYTRWIHSFDFIDAVLFVASLDNYNLGYYEDPHYNCMDGQLWMWESLVNRLQFKNAPKVLWLNKADLFQEKIKSTSIKECLLFQDYNGDPYSFDECIEYIRKMFKDRYHVYNRDNDEMYCHVTCAIDGENMKKHVHNLVCIIHDDKLFGRGYDHPGY